MIKRFALGLAAAFVVLAGSASAHVVLAEPEARAGSYYAGFFRIGHGCDERGTIAVRVEIPESVLIARPQPKPGWTLEIEHVELAAPAQMEGHVLTERVAAITWRGYLPPALFDQFGVLMKLPERAGPLYFPVVQSCDGAERRWIEVPARGQAWGDLESPAPVLTLTAPQRPARRASAPSRPARPPTDPHAHHH